MEPRLPCVSTSYSMLKSTSGRQCTALRGILMLLSRSRWSTVLSLKHLLSLSNSNLAKTQRMPCTGPRPHSTHSFSPIDMVSYLTMQDQNQYKLTLVPDVEIAYGILYYMETSETHRIHAIRHELRHMVMQRNEMACYVRDRLQLPPMLKSSH